MRLKNQDVGEKIVSTAASGARFYPYAFDSGYAGCHTPLAYAWVYRVSEVRDIEF